MRFTGHLGLLLLSVAAAACGRAQGAGPAPEDPLGVPELQSPAARVDPPPPPPPSCLDDAWTTYGHDAARTSTTGGCLFAPLRASWSFSPRWVKGTPSHATRTIVAGDAVYVTGGIGPTPTVWRLDAKTGAIEWTYITMADATRDGWPTLAGTKVMLVDDGVYSIDAATGKGHRGELDAWGESLTDGDQLFAENDRYWDGYGLYLSAFDLEAKLLWRRDYDALVRFFTAPDVGGLAMDGGRVVHAAQHGALHSTGLTAYDPASGERAWRVAVSPVSSPSIADGRAFGIEHWKGEAVDRLVARTVRDGVLVWSHEVPDARGPAPLLAAGLVVVHAGAGVLAFDRASGGPVWSTPLPRTAQAVQSATTMAAATGSGTLAVVSGRAVHLLRLSDGTETWTADVTPHAKRVEGPVIAEGALYVVADGALLRFEGADHSALR
ncbi:MAG TPA: PQQ-binding-like beta-propeller repeat protein [Polyangiaceae bacterium]